MECNTPSHFLYRKNIRLLCGNSPSKTLAPGWFTSNGSIYWTSPTVLGTFVPPSAILRRMPSSLTAGNPGATQVYLTHPIVPAGPVWAHLLRPCGTTRPHHDRPGTDTSPVICMVSWSTDQSVTLSFSVFYLNRNNLEVLRSRLALLTQ
jgi:hypothetical protein